MVAEHGYALKRSKDALIQAALSRNASMFDLVAEARAEGDRRPASERVNSRGFNALHKIARHGKHASAMAKHLVLKHGFPVDQADYNGRTPAVVAAVVRRVRCQKGGGG